MPRTVVFEGVSHSFPDDATDEEIASALEASAKPAEAAPAETPSGYSHPLARYGATVAEKLPRAALDLVNPLAYARSAGGLLTMAARAAKAGANPVSLGVEFGPDTVAAVQGIKEAVSTPEGLGDLTATGLTAAIPVGGLLGKVAKFGAEHRVGNVIKATGATMKADKSKIEKLVQAGRLELPIAATRGSLGKKVAERIAEAGTELDAAKAGLQGLPEGSVAYAVKALEAERPVVNVAKTVPGRRAAGFTSPAPVSRTVNVEESLNPAMVAALDKQIGTIKNVAGTTGIKPADLQKLKEQAQDAARAAYKAARGAGQDVGAGAEASEMAAKAIRETLENSPDIPKQVRDALTKANRRIEPLLAIQDPIEAARLGGSGIGMARSAEALAGRAVLPAVMGAGGYMLGPAGAAAGLGAGALMQSVLFNTLSAAAKLKVAKIMQTEGVQAAVQAAFAAHITSNAARRQGAATP